MNNYAQIYDEYFKDELPINARYLFIPHAGFQYSEFAAWCALQKVAWHKIRRIILLTTAHFVPRSMNGISIIDSRYSNLHIMGYMPSHHNLPVTTFNQFYNEHSWQFLLPLFNYFADSTTKLHIQIIL